jgi:competence protein ComEC
MPEPRPHHPLRRHRRLTLGLLLLGASLLAACSDGSSPTPAADPPRITVEGVEPGATYEGPVTITVRVEPSDAAVSVQLNGERFVSGTTVTSPGPYTLAVEATRGGLRSEVTVPFTVLLGGDRRLILRMFDLGPEGLGGGGDAILVTDSSAAGMVHGLVDAGPRGEPGGVLVEGWVADRLQELGVDTLAFLQLTHAHADHLAGMVPILERLHVQRFVTNGQVRSFFRYEDVLQAAALQADTLLVLAEPWVFDLGPSPGAPRTVHLPGLPAYLGVDTNDGRLINEGSIGTAIEFDGVRLFLTGDGENEANDRWRTSFGHLTEGIDILKVGHHGANNAIFDDRSGVNPASSWLAHTRPSLFLVTSNGVSHPRSRALARLLGIEGLDGYCTHVHGTVEVRIAGGVWSVEVERNADRVCVPGSEATT